MLLLVVLLADAASLRPSSGGLRNSELSGMWIRIKLVLQRYILARLQVINSLVSHWFESDSNSSLANN